MGKIGTAAGGGLGSSKLALATATAADVKEGKTFYAGSKELKTGTGLDDTIVGKLSVCSRNHGGATTDAEAWANAAYGKASANGTQATFTVTREGTYRISGMGAGAQYNYSYPKEGTRVLGAGSKVTLKAGSIDYGSNDCGAYTSIIEYLGG